MSVETYQHFINGEWVDGLSGETLPTYCPGDGELIAHIQKGSPADVDRAVAAATQAFNSDWSSVRAAPQRAQVLRAIAQGLRDNLDTLAELESRDCGKTITESFMIDVHQAADTFDFYADWATQIYGDIIPVPGDVLNLAMREPVGVCGAITAWNFPIMYVAWKCAPALAAGNTVVMKPSELTSLTALEAARIMHDAGLPPGCVNIVTGDGAGVGAAMAEHPGIAKLSFTGSVATGGRITQASVSNMKRLTMELGGKSPNIIFADADLDRAVSGALNAIFLNAGQVCVAGSRLYLQAPIYDAVVSQLVDRVGRIPVGHPLDWESRVGALITPQHRDKVLGFVRAGVDAGATLLTGGRIPETPGLAGGNYLEPTLFTDVADDAMIGCEEIFGPVLSIFRFEDEDEVVARANANPYGLAAAVWTRDLNRAMRVSRALQSGTVWVNTYMQINPYSPHGGVKRSGYGRDLGKYALDAYTQVKNVYIDYAEDEFLTIFE
jgi:aldehyde dehydrogenase (NAD+)/phenylacetaldehyde dehydrogenase